MGFLSLFSRKGKLERHQPSRLLKSQPYSSTVESLPPVRGAYPVAGNGQNALETLSKSSKFSQSHLSLASKDSPAPPPAIHRFRDHSAERPNTAPYGDRHTADEASKRTESLRGPPVSFRKPRPAQPAEAGNDGAQVLPKKSLTPTRMTFAHQRVNSMKSDAGKAFVDLLDAQDVIKPADFRSRVKAAGARDYGEDVADRNIGENGVNLDSTTVQAFYATASQSPTQVPEKPAPHRAGVRRLHADQTGLYHQITRQISVESGLRSKSLNSSHPSAFPERPSSAVPRPVGMESSSTPANSSKVRAMRRQTFNNFAPRASPAPTSSNTQAKARPKSFQRGATNALRDHGLFISTKRANQRNAAPGWDTTSPEPDSASPVLRSSGLAPRDAALLSRSKAAAAAAAHGHASLYGADAVPFQFQLNDQPASTSRPGSKRGSVASSTFTSFTKRPSRSQSLGAIPPFAMRDAATGGGNSLPYPRPKSRNPGMDDGDASAPPPSVRSGPSRADGGHDDIYSYPRTRSLMSTLSRTRPDELDEVPIRTSSLRHWSMTSATPTTSSSSSNPFPRPHSRQTANTSVDLTNTLPSILNSSRSSINSNGGPYQQHPYCAAPDAGASPGKPRTPGFNIDDYLSSDDDSFTAPRRPRGEGEETLLFNSAGYGFGGTQLPGLEDSLAAPAPEVPNRNRSRSPRSSVSLPAGGLRQAYASPSSPPGNGAGGQYSPARYSRARKYIIDSSFDHEPEDDRFYYYYSTDAAAAAADDFLARILPPGQAPDRRSLKRLSALGSVYQQHPQLQALGLGDDVIEEERHEKIDVAEAVRMRKEAKAMKRMMAAAATKRRSQAAPPPPGSGTEKPRAPRSKGKERANTIGRRKIVVDGKGVARELEDEACHADVEQ